MKYRHYLYAALGITSAVILASCQEADFGFNPEQYEYRSNFEKMYGSIQDIPTWDFSSYNLRQMGLEGGPSAAAMTRGLASNYSGSVNTTPGNSSDILKSEAPSNVVLTDGWYSVPSGTLGWLDTSLPEGDEYSDGKSFVLGHPQDNFAIIPIYQGHAGMCWELHLVDKATNKDYKLWEKSQGIRYNVDFDADNAIDVARHEIKDWGVWADINGDGHDDNCGEQEKYIPIGYLFKAWEPSFGDLKISCTLPSVGCNINGRIVDFYYDGENHIGNNVSYDGGSKLVFTSENQSYTISAETVAKMKEHADHLYFELWWNDGWKSTGNKCYFGYYEDNHATFHLTTANKNSGNHIGKLYLEGRISNEVGHTVGKAAAGVEAKPILINGSQIKGDMYLYLKITKQDVDNPGYASLGACQRSDENMMVALPITGDGIPGNVKPNEYMIIGCEDANNTGSSGTDNSDWDYNDIVFLLVGQGSLPKVKEVIAEKRYMIEDLGSTYDFDFNDIVVDVTQSATKNYLGQYIKEDGTPYSDAEVTSGTHLNSTAVIRHLCGTIPFQIRIGSTDFGVLPGKVNCNPALDSDYSGKYEKTNVNWNPNTNNITMTVWPTKAGQSGTSWSDSDETGFVGSYPLESQTFSFPSAGEFPYIIACNQDVSWMDENVSVPENWFKTWPKQYYDYNGTTAPDPIDPTTTTIILFEGTKNLGTWENNGAENTLVISKTQFADSKSGDQITITINARSGNDNKIKIAKNVDGWPNAVSSTPDYGFDFASVNSMDIAIDQTFIDAVSSNDIVIYGCGVTVSKITLSKQ